MLSATLSLLPILLVLTLAAIAVSMAYLIVRYTPIICRIFEEMPMFLPLRLPPRSDGEDVRLTTADGLELRGSYLKARGGRRTGVIVFCHEFLSNRWSYFPYADSLRDLGFDLFTFDFRNHGESAGAADYQPLQWVSDHEVRDLQTVLDYLRSREDRDPAGFGLFGISKGGGTALVAAARSRDVWGVITDGAFPTQGTMLAYVKRWAEIFVESKLLCSLLRDYAPTSLFAMLCVVARRRAARRLSCRFPNIEKAVARITPRPWLMIHGAKDAYIGPAIAESLFARAGEPKELWIVPGAKHNRCREVDAREYARRVDAFLGRSSPRPLLDPADRPEPDSRLGPDAVGTNEPDQAPATHAAVTLGCVSKASPVPSMPNGLAASITG